MPKRHFVATIVVAKNVDRIETKIYRTKLHAGGVAGHSNKKPGLEAGLLQFSLADELLRWCDRRYIAF